MRDIGKRIEKLEEAIGVLDCICGDQDTMRPCAVVVVEDGWDEARIQQAEAAKAITCPVHGVQMSPILRLSGSDVYG